MQCPTVSTAKSTFHFAPLQNWSIGHNFDFCGKQPRNN